MLNYYNQIKSACQLLV